MRAQRDRLRVCVPVLDMTAPLLELRHVHTHIGAYHILHGVDLAVPPDAVTMLLGL